MMGWFTLLKSFIQVSIAWLFFLKDLNSKWPSLNLVERILHNVDRNNEWNTIVYFTDCSLFQFNQLCVSYSDGFSFYSLILKGFDCNEKHPSIIGCRDGFILVCLSVARLISTHINQPFFIVSVPVFYILFLPDIIATADTKQLLIPAVFVEKSTATSAHYLTLTSSDIVDFSIKSLQWL